MREKDLHTNNFSSTQHVGDNMDPQVKELVRKVKTIVIRIVVGLAVVIALLGSWYTTDEDEYAVVRTFGHVSMTEEPGFKFKIPVVQRVTKLPKSSMQMAVGYDLETDQSVPNESFMITEDYNFVNVDFYFEYFINDPIAYMFASEQPEVIVKNLAQSYIRDTVGTHNIDEVLTTGKYEIQGQIKDFLVQRLEAENIGIMITNAVIQDSEVPTTEVAAAFKNVEDAKQGMDTDINLAKADQNTRIPAANANADKIIKQAQAEKEALIAEAEGQVARFNSLYDEYVKFPLVTKERMFYETMETVLPTMEVYITDGNTTSMLPLDKFGN